MVLPSIEVSHLAPSSSFFAAVLQPLGITFVDAPAASSAIIFGADGHPVLQLRQAPSARCRLSSLVFAAPTRLAVASFLESALKANPDQSLPKEKASTTEDGVARATVVDLDGNTMEAVYPDPRPHSAVRYSGTAVRKTQSTTSEVGRILEWNYNVASSDASPSATRPRPGPSSTSPSLAIQMSPLRQPASAAPPSKTDAATHGSSLINTSTVVGALLGVAAGAALTYGIVSRDKDRNTHHDTEVPRTLPRRATFPDRPALMEATKASSYPGVPKVAPRKALPYPEKGSLQVHGVEPRQPRPHEHDIASFGKHPTRGSPELAAPRSVAAARSTGSNRAGTFVDGKSSAARQPGGEFDTRSRLSSRNGHGRAPSTRSRSEAPSRRASVVGAERDRLSYARPPSHQTDAPRETQSCQRVACEPDQSSYISAQSRRTEHSYSRAPSASRGSRSEHGSLHRGSYLSARHIQLPASQAPTYLSGRDVPLPESQAASFASAREVPLPESNLGSNSVNWNDDLVSIAPSDSISCVGTRASQRSRRFQRR